MTMSQKTNTTNQYPNFKSFAVIHELYQQALKNADDIMGILSNFRNLLKDPHNLAKIPDEEKESFLIFRSYVDNCYFERMSTFKLTNLINDVLTVILYIVIYYNSTFEAPHIDMNVNSRRKSLKRDLAKCLKKSYSSDISLDSSNTGGVKDRFGLRGILLNKNLSTEKNVILLNTITKLIFGILTDTTEKNLTFWSGLKIITLLMTLPN